MDVECGTNDDATNTVVIPELLNEIVLEMAHDVGVFRVLLTTSRAFLAMGRGVKWWQEWCGLRVDDERTLGNYVWKTFYAALHDVQKGIMKCIHARHWNGDNIAISGIEYGNTQYTQIYINKTASTISSTWTELAWNFADEFHTKVIIAIRCGKCMYYISRSTDVATNGRARDPYKVSYHKPCYTDEAPYIIIPQQEDPDSLEPSEIIRGDGIASWLATVDEPEVVERMMTVNADAMFGQLRYLDDILRLRDDVAHESAIANYDHCDHYDLFKCTTHGTCAAVREDQNPEDVFVNDCWGRVAGNECEIEFDRRINFGDELRKDGGMYPCCNSGSRSLPEWALWQIAGDIKKWER